MTKQFNIEIDMSASISEHMAKDMITIMVEKQTGKKVKHMEPVYVENQFKGYTIKFFHVDAPPRNFKPSTEFIANNFGVDA
jgi:hypothetical protein